MVTKVTVNVTAPDVAPNPTASFTQKLIELDFRLASAPGVSQPPTFSESGGDSVTVSGARVSARVQNSGSPAGARAQIDVWGLTPSLMNQLSTLGLAFNIVPRNAVTIRAGDRNTGLSAVFTGTILSAYADYGGMPNVPLHVEAVAGLIDGVASATPSSFPQSTTAQDVLAGLARQMGIGFENNGVSRALPAGRYYSGNYREQIRQVARDARVNAEQVIGAGGQLVLAIWPLGGNRGTTNIPIISKDTSMIRAPSFTAQGVTVQCRFDPAIAFGGLVQIRSSVLQGVTGAQRTANPLFQAPQDSIWAVNKLDLALDSLVPKGEWSETIWAFNPNYPRPAIPAS